MLLALVSVSASAYDFAVDGVYYTVTSSDDLTCEVTSGDAEYGGDVIIPSTVTYDGKTYSVTSIHEYAFSYCSSLSSVTIPESVTSIGDYAFAGSTDLASVTIPKNVTSIDHGVFMECTGLTSITIPESVMSIDYCAFQNCDGLTSVTIPESVTSIGYGSFSGCSSLTSVTIPESVTSIDQRAFDGCNNIEDLYLGIGSDCTLGNDALPTYVTTLHVPYKSTAYYESFWIGHGNLKEYGKISVTGAGYGTYYINKPFTLPEGLEAGIVTGVNNSGELTVNYLYKGGDVVPAGTALLVKGEKCTKLFDITESEETAPTNLLRGSEEAETTTGGDRYYMLSYDANGENLGFYWGADNGGEFTNGAHKAYLALSDAQAKKLTDISGAAFNEETGVTGITTVTTTTAPAAVYTLDGRKVSVQREADLPAGLYIVNGKKVIVK